MDMEEYELSTVCVVSEIRKMTGKRIKKREHEMLTGREIIITFTSDMKETLFVARQAFQHIVNARG